MILSRIFRRTNSVVRLWRLMYLLANGRAENWETDAFATGRTTNGNDAIQHLMSFSAKFQGIKLQRYKGQGEKVLGFLLLFTS